MRKSKPPNIPEDPQQASSQIVVKRKPHNKKLGVLEVETPWPEDAGLENDDMSNLNGKFKRTLSLSKSGRCKSMSKQNAHRQSIMSSDLYNNTPSTRGGVQIPPGGNTTDGVQTSNGGITDAPVRGSPGVTRGSPERMGVVQQQNIENRNSAAASNTYSKNTPPRKKTGQATAL